MQLRSRGAARIRYVAKSQDVPEGWQYESVPFLAGPAAGELGRYLEHALDESHHRASLVDNWGLQSCAHKKPLTKQGLRQ
jgi:hypothetical protein